MKIKVLGSSAGGGFPQWNCNCRNCDGVRRGTLKATRRTQSSITSTAAIPLSVLVIDAQIDHVTGLLMLRERDTPLPLYATDSVWQDLCSGFPVAPILSHYCGVEHLRIALDGAPLVIDALNGVQIDALPLSSKAPPYSPHRHAPERGDNIGLVFTNRQTGKRVFYAPGLGAVEAHVHAAMGEADLLLVDGTLWTGDEMICLGLSKKTAADMGHLEQSGPGGMIEVLDSLEARNVRKVLIHINNTNPILVEDGPERRILTEHGIEVAHDGMTFEI
jgi:pyrroloquinoline quinone biosynthesis protein B